MKMPGLWTTSFALLCGLLVSGQAAGRPNIIFILVDDLRWDALGCNGSPFGATPHLDRMAREGVNFRNFFVTTPLCSPSRASFLTGLYARTHRVINNDKPGLDVISHTLLSWPRLLRQAGYETAMIGKWHMGQDDSRRPGWDTWISFKGQGAYIQGVVNENGTPRQLDGHMTDYLNEKAVEFVKRLHPRPYVLWFSHKAAHYPYLPAPRNETRFAEVRYAPPVLPPEDLRGKPVVTRKIPESERVDWLELEGANPEPAESRYGRPRDTSSVVRDQLRCLADIDDGLGALLEALRQAGKLDDTMVIFAGDNGYLHGEHGQFDNKRWAYEPSLRVPFVLRYPKLARPGTVIDAMVLNIDLAPSMLDLAGASSPEKMQGRSFLPLLRDPKASWRDAFLAEYFLEKIAARVPEWRAVRTERWKYIHYPALGPEYDELYDLASDPGEWRNIQGDAEAKEPLNALKKRMKEMLGDIR